MKKPRFAILMLGICVLTAGVTVFVLASGDRLRAKPRREWRDQAIARLERRLSDRQALEAEIGRLGRTLAATRPASDSWIGEGVLVMKNGDWIACESICSKEDSRIHDLFLGRGSDGKWYYSTFHFCRGRHVLHMEQWQPASLAQFVDAYWLVPFDRRSDDCLKATWTGTEPWGNGKVQPAESPKR